MRFLFNNNFTTLLLTFIFVFIYYLLGDITGYLNKIKSDLRVSTEIYEKYSHNYLRKIFKFHNMSRTNKLKI